MSASRSSRWTSRLTAAGLRNLALFVGGAVGMVWEAGFVAEPRVILVMAYLGFLGVPAFNGFDRLLRRPAAGSDTTTATPSADVTAVLPPADTSAGAASSDSGPTS